MNALKRNAGFKGFCMILNGLLGGLFCILSGAVAVGIILALILMIPAVFYYCLQAGESEPMYPDNTTLIPPVRTTLMIASWPIALAASLITASNAGKLEGLWVGIAVSFTVSLLLQSGMWKETPEWAKTAAKNEREGKVIQQIFDRIRDGEIVCASCGARIQKKYSMALKDERVAVLCPDCMPWKKLGGVTEVQGMNFFHLEL